VIVQDGVGAPLAKCLVSSPSSCVATDFMSTVHCSLPRTSNGSAGGFAGKA